MSERVTIIDKHGAWYSIELFEDDKYFAMRVYHETQPVGYARCLVEDDHVELTDIKIYGRLERNKLVNIIRRPFRKFMKKNYQSRGIGSKLLKEVIDYSKEIGAKRIHGILSGNKELLAIWYSMYGFEVNMLSGKIELRLDEEDKRPGEG